MTKTYIGTEIEINNKIYKVRKEIIGTNYHYYITIQCEDCGITLEKRIRVDRPFIIKCDSCVNKRHPWNIGKHLTDEDKLNKSIAHNHSNHHSVEMNKAIGLKQIGKIITDEQKQKMSVAHKGEVHSEEQKQKVSITLKELYKNPEYKDKVARASRLGSHVRPTRPEERMIELLKVICPNQYEYTGNGRAVFGGLCPDFLNIDGQKKIVEVFGNYWHSQAVSGKTEEQEVSDRKAVFAQFGFDTLIIWERELENDLLNDTVQKVKEFNNKVIIEEV